MNAAAQLPFQPPQDNAGAVRGFVLATLVHLLLFTFLYFGISWTSKTPEAVSVDLYSPLPSMSAPPAPKAAPPPPEPPPVVEEAPQPVEPPPPAPPDIRIKEPPKKPEPPKKAEPPKKIEHPKPVEEPKKLVLKPIEPKPALPKDNVASEADKELKKFNDTAIASDAGRELAKMNSGAAGRAARTWGERVAALIRSKVPVSVADAVPGNPTAVFEVTLLPGREVGLVKLLRSSGFPAYDEAAGRAIQAISPLPPFTEGMEPPRVFKLEARPKDQ
jgi:colicin import membrane protein